MPSDRTWHRPSRGLTALLTCFLLALMAPAPAQAALSSTPERSWSVNGRVYSSVIVGDNVYVGGSFSQATSPQGEVVTRRNLAAFSLSTGELQRGFVANAGSQVRALATDGETLFVGGHFGSINGVWRSRIARVSLSAGAVATNFRADADGGVLAIEYAAGELYVGGAFTEIGGRAQQRLAKLDPVSGTVDTGFTGSANERVHGLEKHPTSSVVYAGGRFTSLGGASRTGVGAISSTTGTALPLVFGETVRPILDIALDDTGSRLFGALGAGRNNVTAWGTNNGARHWHTRVDGDVQAVEYFGGHTYFGFHDGYQGDTRLKLLGAEAETGALLTDFLPHFDQFWGVFSIAASPDGLVAGGEFTQVSGVPAEGFVRFLGQPGKNGAPSPQPPPPDDEPDEDTQVIYVPPSASGWRYWDQGPLGSGWAASGYDDAGWLTGSAELGYGDGDEATVIGHGPLGRDKHMTSYFRMEFMAGLEPTELTLRLLADDGAVVYLNGQEEVRDNMPDGPIDGTTAASSGREGKAERTWRTFTVDPSLIQLGRNVLAVEVHQDRPNSGDLSMDAELTAFTTGQ